MEYGISRNASGYYDPTAYEAMKNYMKGENEMDIYQGDIFELESANGNTREAIILSVHDNFSTILILTENDRLPFNVNCQGLKYTDPRMIQYAYNDRFKGFIRSMNQKEIDEILQAVVDGLGYVAPAQVVAKIEPKIEVQHQDEEKDVLLAQASLELTKAQAERDVYKSLYENLISSMVVK